MESGEARNETGRRLADASLDFKIRDVHLGSGQSACRRLPELFRACALPRRGHLHDFRPSISPRQDSRQPLGMAADLLLSKVRTSGFDHRRHS